jgi:hypothetical protein
VVKPRRVRLPKLKPSSAAISFRLPLHLLEAIKVQANKRDVPLLIADQDVAGRESRVRVGLIK